MGDKHGSYPISLYYSFKMQLFSAPFVADKQHCARLKSSTQLIASAGIVLTENEKVRGVEVHP